MQVVVVVVVVPVLSTGTEESPRVSLTAAELISTGSEHFLLRSEEQIIIKKLCNESMQQICMDLDICFTGHIPCLSVMVGRGEGEGGRGMLGTRVGT